MTPKTKAQSGTVESSDIHILIEPNNTEENIIELTSSVSLHYDTQIRNDINEVLNQFKITGAKVIAHDKGALSLTIKARTETAVKRSLEIQEGVI